MTPLPPTSPCLFCNLPPARVIDAEGPVFAIRDGFPVAPGHTLVIPRRHVASFRDLDPAEWDAALRLVRRLAAEIQRDDPSVTGFNFGINDGADAGQSVFHVHLHLIPRRHGDHPHPRGGVRGIFPRLADYPAAPPAPPP